MLEVDGFLWFIKCFTVWVSMMWIPEAKILWCSVAIIPTRNFLKIIIHSSNRGKKDQKIWVIRKSIDLINFRFFVCDVYGTVRRIWRKIKIVWELIRRLLTKLMVCEKRCYVEQTIRRLLNRNESTLKL